MRFSAGKSLFLQIFSLELDGRWAFCHSWHCFGTSVEILTTEWMDASWWPNSQSISCACRDNGVSFNWINTKIILPKLCFEKVLKVILEFIIVMNKRCINAHSNTFCVLDNRYLSKNKRLSIAAMQRRFRALFGVSRSICAGLGNCLTDLIPYKGRPHHLFKRLLFLKFYPIKSILKSILTAAEKNIRIWVRVSFEER